MGMTSLNRRETRIEDRTCHTQVLNNGTTTEVIAHEEDLVEDETNLLENTVRFHRTLDILTMIMSFSMVNLVLEFF